MAPGVRKHYGKRGMPVFTSREIQIASKILSARGSIRIKDLADEFQVSSRTVQYDLENIKFFFKKQCIEYCSSPGKGIWVNCMKQQREHALAELSQQQKINIHLSQETRVKHILLQLLFSEGYITAGGLAEELNVSRGTILSDMDYVNVFLEGSGLFFKRQVRLGYRLDGSEIALRSLAEKLLRDSMSVYDIYKMIGRIKDGISKETPPLQLIGVTAGDYKVVEEVMIRAFRDHGSLLLEENIVIMVTRLLVSLSRVRIKRYIGDSMQEALKGDLYWHEVYEKNGLPALQDEFDYVQGRYQKTQMQVDIAGLSVDLIQKVSIMENFPYYQDNTLYSRLLNHLRHDFSHMFSTENKDTDRNPFHDLIIKNHYHLYKSIRTVCRHHIDDAYLFPNESFISYLALHFLIAQKNLGVGRKMRVVFVCATGQGAAKLIERMLEAEIRRLEIVKHCSLTETAGVVENLKPDFIISVFPIEATVPVVVVEPLPTKADIESIRKLIDNQTEDNEILNSSQPVTLSMDSNKQEEVSQEVILVGLKIYAALQEKPVYAVKQGLELAFLAHVMLLANRYVFDKQFTAKSKEERPLDCLIKNRLSEIGVFLTLDEIQALTYYFKEQGEII
jgi:mannitol operon transcriptional antiterminator